MTSGARLWQQRIDDMQGIRQHLQVRADQVRAHLQRRGPAVDHDGRAGKMRVVVGRLCAAANAHQNAVLRHAAF